MKITNKYIGMLLSIGMMLAIVTGCQDPSDFRKVRNEAITNLQRGGMIDFDDIRQKKLLKGDDPNTGVFTALIYDPNNNAASYNVGISVGGNRVQLGDNYTTFPTTLEIKASDIRAATGNDLEFGEAYTITGEVTTDDGTVFGPTAVTTTTNGAGETTVTGGNTDNELLATGSPQALSFPVTVVCGSVTAPSALAGTWRADETRHSSRVGETLNNNDYQIVAGPGANQFTIVNFYNQGNDFVVTQDPESGDLSADAQLSYVDDTGRSAYDGAPVSSQIEAVLGPQAARNYGCANLIVLYLYHTRADTGGGALSSIRSEIRLTKQ